MFHLSTCPSSFTCPICQQCSECSMQRTMLAAVQSTDKQLIAPWYLMRISAHLAFSSSSLVKHLSPYTGRIPE